MKEIIIKSPLYKDIMAQILDGEVALFQFDEDSYSDGDGYIYEVYKVLKKIEKLGGFKHIKKDEADDVVYV